MNLLQQMKVAKETEQQQAGQPTALDLATCSLPVSSVQEAIVRLNEAAEMADKTNNGMRTVFFRGSARELAACLARETERQPAENVQDVPRPARQNEKESK